MEIREKIQQKCERIAANIADHGCSEGTEIATQMEMLWLALQMTLRGVLFSYSADESTYQNGDESYYYYWAISASEERDKVDGFLRCYAVLSANELKKLYILVADDSRQYDNVKLVRRQVMRRDRQRRQREKKERLEWEQREKEERLEREQREEEKREAAMQEAYDHRDDLTWLVSRIESLGWEVTLKKKTTD